MINLRHRNSSINALSRAIRASQTLEPMEPYNGQLLSLVGVAYASTSLSELILTQPTLTNFLVQGTGFSARVTFRPLPSQLPNLQVLSAELKRARAGVFTEDVQIEAPLEKSSFKMDLTMGNSMLSNIQEYEAELDFSEPEIMLLATKIQGEDYYQFIISEGPKLTMESEFTHGLFLLFKARKYDDENIFSSMLVTNTTGAPAPKLNKRDTKKVIDLVMEPNLTGMSLGNALFRTKGSGITSSLYPVETNLEIAETDREYIFLTHSGSIRIPRSDIQYSTVKRVGAGKYLLSLYTSDGVLRLALGY